MAVTQRKYLVFLDIDGVFASSRVHYAHAASYKMWHRFDPVAVDFMNRIHDCYPVEFVVTSTWKNGLDADCTQTEHWVRAAFGNSGFRGSFAKPWKTSVQSVQNSDRAYEVKAYLEQHGTDVADFIIFDDTRYLFAEVLGVKRLVHTDSLNGLLFKHMLNAQSIMGQWHER